MLQLIGQYYTVSDTLGFFSLCFLLISWYLVIGSLTLAAQALFSHVAAGVAGEPLPRCSLNPFAHGRALEGAIMVAIGAWAWHADPVIYWVGIGLVFPWLTVSMGINDGPGMGLHPGRLGDTLIGLGPWGLAVCLLLGGAYWLLTSTLHLWNGFLTVALSGYAFLAAHALCGLIAYQRRKALGLYTLDSPEQRMQETVADRDAAIDAVMTEAHRLCNTGRIREALGALDAHIDGNHAEMDPIIYQRLKRFHHDTLRLEFAVQYLNRLAGDGLGLRAWSVLQESLELEPGFRPNTDATMHAALMAAEQRDILALKPLLEEFPETYPGSAYSAEIDIKRAHVEMEWAGNELEGRRILADLLRVRQDLASHPLVRGLHGE